MPARKPHIKLNNSEERPIKWSYKTRFIPTSEEPERDPDYSRMASRFEASAGRYLQDKEQRDANRTLIVPEHIEYIDIRFQDQFNLSKFSRQYLVNFGLDTVKLTEFNKRVLFSIVDTEKFDFFFQNIRAFIEFGKGNSEIVIDKRITYIDDFSFLTSNNIKQYETLNPIIRLSLLEGLYNFRSFRTIEDSLDSFLRANGVDYIFDRTNNSLEIINGSEDLINEIVDNFDIIFSITSSLSTVIRPSSLSVPERSYGFTIANAEEELPLIGIIDTGIDRRTPLSEITIGGIDKTNTNAFEDIVNHGTAVAALASLGKKPYLVNYRGAIKADAKLVSLKVINSSRAPLPDHRVVDIITEAKQNYPQLKLFVLTISYESYKKVNEPPCDYAYLLDKIAHELDILIFICTANNNHAVNDCNRYDIHYFENEKTNLCAPSESMNNITVGACADNIKPGVFYGISNLKEFPSLYTRIGHLDQERFFSVRKINKHIRKPDLLQPGGDYESSSMFIGTGENATMEVLSSEPTEGFYKNVGTSFSTPLAANLAAQIIKLYPDLRTQSIKALLINSAETNLFNTENNPINKILLKAAGYGLPKEERTLFSDDNSITFILERAIRHKELTIIPIKVPDYLRSLSKNRGLLEVTATLCFSFLPDKDNHLAYCPVFIAFSIFRNKSAEEIKNNYSTSAKLRNTWTQDGYSLAKPILYSNVQKISFTISKDDILSEDGTFKIAVHCFVSPHIKAGMMELRRRISESHQFSLAITIVEKLPPNKLTNRLYSEIIAINNIDVIGTVEADVELES